MSKSENRRTKKKVVIIPAVQGVPELRFSEDCIYLLTGKINSGKSTALKKWVRKWKTCYSVNGVISEPVFQNNRKTAYHGMEIGSAHIYPIVASTPFPEGDNYQMGRFYFNASAYHDLTNRLAAVQSTDLMVIDEVGPLEILQKKGFYPLIHHLLLHTAFCQLWVVRDSCLKDVQKIITTMTKKSPV